MFTSATPSASPAAGGAEGPRHGWSVLASPATLFAFYLALVCALVLYVYRFAVGGVNLSAFRLMLLGWLAWFAVDLVRARRWLSTRHVPLAVIGAAIVIVNAIDFATLDGYPMLRRDIANHLANVTFAGLVACYVHTVERRHAMLRAFVWSSVLTTAIGLYTALYDLLPFEGLIRTFGSEQARALAYVNDDFVYRRATSTFFDPNFYGVYSLLVLIAVMYLWRFHRPTRTLAAFFALNLACLTLTLSRTAVVGLIAALVLAALIDRRSWRFSVLAAAASVALLHASAIVQSYEGREMLRQEAQVLWARWTGSEEMALDHQSRWARMAFDRVANGGSIEDRLIYVRRGLDTFESSPLWGRGSASLVRDDMPWSSAHVSYLTLLARYGILGAAVYAAFLFFPLAVAWRSGVPANDRYLVTVSLGALAVVYLSYDILLFFEVQYLFFGLLYSIAIERLGQTPGVHLTAPPAELTA